MQGQKKKTINKKAQISIYLVVIIAAITIVLIGAVFAPMGVLFNSEMYKAGEQIMLRANESIQGIQNTTVRDSIESGIAAGFAAQEMNIEVNSDLFQYSWVFVVILTVLVAFIFTRRLIEVGGGGFV